LGVFLITEVAQIYGELFPNVSVMKIHILTSPLARVYISGDFFTKSSGHPGSHWQCCNCSDQLLRGHTYTAGTFRFGSSINKNFTPTTSSFYCKYKTIFILKTVFLSDTKFEKIPWPNFVVEIVYICVQSAQ
jgi:hypothetical protein